MRACWAHNIKGGMSDHDAFVVFAFEKSVFAFPRFMQYNIYPVAVPVSFLILTLESGLERDESRTESSPPYTLRNRK